MKSSPNKNIPRRSDWLQIQSENGVLRNVNLNLVEEITFYPDITGEPALDIRYTSGHITPFKGNLAKAIWNLVNQGVSFEVSGSDKQV